MRETVSCSSDRIKMAEEDEETISASNSLLDQSPTYKRLGSHRSHSSVAPLRSSSQGNGFCKRADDSDHEAPLSPESQTNVSLISQGYSNTQDELGNSLYRKDNGDTEEEVPQSLALPPDGGWGWVVLAASFLCNGIVEGLITCFGVLMPEIADYYGTSTAKAALAGSVLIGAFLMSGPIASWFLNKFGGRISAIVGAGFAVLSFLLSILSPSIEIFILLYGLCGGLGVAFFYLPGMVMVGYYFEKKRALAMGIACSGAGIGMLVFAPLTAFLMDKYDWKSTVVLLAGLTLQVVPLGSLFRPLTAPNKDTKRTRTNTESSEALVENGDIPLSRKTSLNLHDSVLLKTFPSTGRRQDAMRSNIELGKLIHADLSEEKPEQNGHARFSSHHHLPMQSRSSNDDVNKRLESPQVNAKHSRNPWHSCHDLPIKQGRHSHTQAMQSQSHSHLPPPQQRVCPSWSISEIQAMSVDGLDHLHLPKRAESLMAISETLEDNKKPASLCKRMLLCLQSDYLELCLQPAFIVLCVGAFLIQVAYFVPIVFITEFAATIAIEPQKGAFLIAIMGICNMTGRLMAGVLANVPRVNTLHLCNLSLIVSGVSTVLITWANSYTLLVIYSVVFGYFSAAFVPLTSLFIVQYLGLDKLTDAFGVLSFVRGVGSMAGPPIAGAILDATSSFEPVFYFAGGLLALSGIVQYILPFTRKIESTVADDNIDC